MPESIAALLFVLGEEGAIVGLTSLGTSIALAGASYAVTATLAPGEKSAGAGRGQQELQGQTLTRSDPAASWKIIYGKTRIGGNVVFRTTSRGAGENVETHVVPLTGAPDVRVNGADVFISEVSVDRIVVSGEQGEIIDYVSAAGTYTQAGGVYAFDESMRGLNLRFIYNAHNSDVRYLHVVLVLAAHRSKSIDQIYLGDAVVDFDASGNAIGAYAGYLKCFKHLGIPGEPADAKLVAAMPQAWTANHTLEGHTYLYLQFARTGQTNPWAAGIPNISAVGQWKDDILDPRTGLRGWTDNAALVIADYMANPQWGLNAPIGVKIDGSDLIAAANICDESINLSAGGTEPRYTINGVVDTATLPRDALPQLVAAMAGRCVYVGGKWRLHAGAYSPPVITISQRDLRAGVSFSTRLSRREAFNAIGGTFLSPVNNWQIADFPPLESAAFRAEDGGELIYKNVQLPYTNSASMAQRLCKIDLLRARRQVSGEIPINLTGYKAQPPDTVVLDIPAAGVTGDTFELFELRLNLAAPAPGVDYLVRETAADIYDWNVSEEKRIQSVPSSARTLPYSVRAPGVPSAVEEIYEAFGRAYVRARVTWAPSVDAPSQRYTLQWKKRGVDDWSEAAGLSTLLYDILDVEQGDYQFRVRTVNAVGFTSPWSYAEKTFIGLSAIPADVADFAVTKVGGTAFATWAPASDIDVRDGGALVVRHTPVLVTPVWEDGVIFDTFPGNAVSGLLPLVTGTYMARWRDTGGRYSNTAALFVATEGMLSAFTTLYTSTQGPGFSGSKTNITLDGGLGGIRLTTVPGTGEYLFDAAMDLSTVLTRRFELDIVARSYAIALLFDSHPGNFDAGGPFDGITNINECNATVYIRTSNDAPAANTWGAWTPFVVAEFTCRSAQFKLVLDSSSDAHDIYVSTLTLHVKVPT